MAEKRLALDQIPSAVPGSGTDRTRQIASIVKVDGPNGEGALAVLPGTTLAFSLPVAGKVTMFASLHHLSSGAANLPTSINLSIRVDGVDHIVAANTLDIGVPGPSYAIGAAGSYAENMLAGPHTFAIAVSGNGTVVSSVTQPTTLIIDYPEELVGGGGAGDANLVKVDAVGSGDIALTAGLTTVPGTPIAFSLERSKTVMFAGYATVFATTFADCFLILRVDGVDYRGSEFHLLAGGVGDIEVSRALVLGAGPHTAELVATMPSGAGASIYTAAGGAPGYISAIYATGGGGTTIGDAATFQKTDVVKTDGIFSTVSLVFVAVPGTSIAFNLVEAQVVDFTAYGTSPDGGFGETTAFGIRVDGVDYPGTFAYSVGGEQHGVFVNRALSLAAGAHTAEVIIRFPGGGGSARLLSNVDFPTVLTALYNQPVFGAGSLTSQEAVTAGAPGSFYSNPLITYDLVPGTLVTIDLIVPQTVFFNAVGCGHIDGANRSNTQIGIRIDGINYDGGYEQTYGLGSFVSGTLVASKAIALGVGIHTAQIVIRRIGGSSADIWTESPGDKPARLTALYTNPQELVDLGIGTLANQEAENTTGVATTNATTTYALIPATLVTVTVPVAQVVKFSGFASVFGAGTSGIDAQLGVRIDGIDYNGTVSEEGRFIIEPTQGLGIYVEKAISLAPGSHTAQLVVRQSTGATGIARVFNSVDKPTRLTAIYTAPQDIVTTILDHAKDDTSGGFVTASAAPVIIPSPSVAFTQLAVGDVEAHLTATAYFNGAFRVRANTFLVLDGVTFIKVGYAGVDGVVAGGQACGGVAVFPAVALGAHTIQAALATEDPFGATILRGVGLTQAPLTITVRHN
jgi:hypothetical protein